MKELPLNGKQWALISCSDEDLERLSMSGSLPDSSKEPWFSISLDRDPQDSLEVSIPHRILIPSKDLRPEGYGLKPETVKIKGRKVFVRGRWQKILGFQSGPTLVSSLPLIPQSSKVPPKEVICVFSKKSELASAVQSSLLLGNLALSVSPCEINGSSIRVFLLRVGSPSVFLLEKWSDLHVPIYRSGPSNFWVKLGFRHPWENSFKSFDADHIPFISEEGWWSAPKVSFRSAFEFVSLEMESVHQKWAENSEALKFQVSLRWGFRGTAPSPELWLLEEEDLPKLEDLFAILPHSELDNLQLACLKEDSGTPRFAVRESLTGRSRQYLDFGEEYCSFGGFPNLFTPVHYRLEPPVPRDMLGRLLEVTAGTLTVVTMPGKPSEKASMEVLHISERSFRTLHSLVDHIIQGGRRFLSPLLEKSFLDLGSFARLPSRPVVAVPKPEPKEPKTKVKKGKVSTDPQEEDLEEIFEERKTPKKKKRIRTQEIEEKILPRLVEDSELLDAEVAAVQNLREASTWGTLARLNFNRSNFLEGVSCYEHALWIASEEQRPKIEEEFLVALNQFSVGSSQELFLRNEIMTFSGAYKGEEAPKFAIRLKNLLKSLRETEPLLSKKSRWLLWSKILKETPDAVEATRVTESLLGELSLSGISERDSFEFIRRHVRNSIEKPQLPAGIGDLLEKMLSFSREITRTDYRLEALGAIATAWESAENPSRTLSLLQEVGGDLEGLPKDSGANTFAIWGGCATRLGQDRAEELFQGSVSRFSNMREGLEKDRILLDILEQVQYGSLLSSETSLISDLLITISEQRPRRQCLQFSDCAESFFDLGASMQVSEHLSKLLETPEVLADTYYLDHALKALVICQSGRPPEPELSNRIFSEILSRGQLEESSIKTLDTVLAGCDPEVVDSLRPHISRAEPSRAMLLESTLIRALASSGDLEEGWALLQERLGQLWSLERTQDRTKILCRFLSNIPHFGRPASGQELLQEAVGKLPGSDLGVREQREILECSAEVAGRLGASDLVSDLLSRIVDSFDGLISNNSYGISHLFEILGLVVDQVIRQGRDEKGLQIVQRAVESISTRLHNKSESDHPYFVHLARVKCAIALLSLEETAQGFELLEETASDISSVRMFDGRDRVDLCIEGVKALSLVPLEGDSRIQLLQLLVETGIGKEPQGTFSDSFRRDMIRQTIREVVQRKSAYRLALIKMRTQEEQIIRSRILKESMIQA